MKAVAQAIPRAHTWKKILEGFRLLPPPPFCGKPGRITRQRVFCFPFLGSKEVERSEKCAVSLSEAGFDPGKRLPGLSLETC